MVDSVEYNLTKKLIKLQEPKHNQDKKTRELNRTVNNRTTNTTK